ncbi:MAG: MSMEG_4193 family putative phosphomutase [Acidimicrobiales bacterium]
MPARPKPPKPTTIAFVRHGQTPTTGKVLPGRARGLHLAEQGQAQAKAAAERLSAYAKVAAVYASPLERARETAAPIAKALGLRVRSERGLLECEFGSWTGRELKELARLPEWGQVQRNPSMFRFPEGESFLEMQARASDAVRRIVAAHPGEIVVCVSHADPIKALAADAMGSHLDHFQRFVVSPCSITVIAYSAAGPTVLCLNSTDRLPAIP